MCGLVARPQKSHNCDLKETGTCTFCTASVILTWESISNNRDTDVIEGRDSQDVQTLQENLVALVRSTILEVMCIQFTKKFLLNTSIFL